MVDAVGQPGTVHHCCWVGGQWLARGGEDALVVDGLEQWVGLVYINNGLDDCCIVGQAGWAWCHCQPQCRQSHGIGVQAGQ